MSDELSIEKLQNLLMELQKSKDIIKNHNHKIYLLNEKITQLENELIITECSKAKLYSILSHDLRSPFNGLLGFANFLTEEAETLTVDEIKTFTSNISSSAKGLLELIDKVFEWVKYDTGRYDFTPSNLDLKYIVDEVFFLFSKKAAAKEVSLVNNIPGTINAFGDNEMIRRVVEHIISNAIKFTPNKGEINVNAADLGDNVELSVKDNGIGISAEDKEKLFRTDVKLSTRGTANEKGPGLGMIISKKIIEINNGSIRVESEEAKGSTFTITLPKDP